MGFYDNYDFSGLKLFSKIKDAPEIGVPCSELLSVIDHLKSRGGITVAEIGIGVGATTLQVINKLGKDDIYYCFDFESTLADLKSDLESGRFKIECQISLYGNTHDEWDSYNWNLSNLVFEMRSRHVKGIFDAVYLDGAHTFLHDGLAICLLKELIKVGGFLVLDDLHWTYSLSEWGRNFAPGRLPQYQMDDKQILRAQEIFLSRDVLFEKLTDNSVWRSIFRKIADAPSRQ